MPTLPRDAVAADQFNQPQRYWDTGDSIVGEYGDHCDGVYEVRNLRNLETFVEKLV